MADRDFRFTKPFRLNPGADLPQPAVSTAALNSKENLDEEFAPTLVPRAKPDEFFEYPPNLRPRQPVFEPLPEEILDFDDGFNQQPAAQSRQAENFAKVGAFLKPDSDYIDQDSALKLKLLVDKLKDYKDQLKKLRDQNLEIANTAYERAKRLQELEAEKTALEEELAELGVDREHKDGMVAYFSKKAMDDEEERKRNEFKRELLLGISLVEGGGENYLGKEEKDKSCWEKMTDCLWRVKESFEVLKGQLKRIESQYDKSIGAYFYFFKFLVNSSLFILLIYMYLLVSHIFIFSGSLSSTCGGSPCFFMYYGFTIGEAKLYSFTLLIMILVSVVVALIKWVRSDRLRYRAEIWGGSDAKLKKFATIAFNSYAWATQDDQEAGDSMINLANLLTNSLAEIARIRDAANRTPAQKRALTIRRAFGISLYIIMLLIGWATIIFLSVYQTTFVDSFSSNFKIIASFILKLGISIVNALAPAIILALTAFERWDDPAYLVKTQLIRIYLAKIMNVVIFALINMEFARNQTFFDYGLSNADFNSDTYNCREDQAGLNLVLLVISDFFVSKAIALILPAYDYIVGKCKKAPMMKREFVPPLMTINLIYSQSLIWITFPYFPYVAFLSPIFLYLDFRFQVWRLHRLESKPSIQTQASDIAVFIMQLYNITLVLVLCYYGLFFNVDMNHSTYGSSNETCGPYPSDEVAWTPINDFFNDNSVTYVLWNSVVNFSPLLWCGILFFATFNSFNDNRCKVVKQYLQVKETESRNQIFELQRSNARMRKQIALNRKVADS